MPPMRAARPALACLAAGSLLLGCGSSGGDTTATAPKPAVMASRNDIEKTLIGQERTRLHKRWIDRLKTKSFVTHF